MKTYKTCGVVMLPTNKEVHDTYCIDDLEYHTDHKLSLNGIEQHLYVTSDEEIKEGDWMIFNSIRLERQQFYVKDVSQCKKIIATTNPKLTLPQVDQSFISHYIKEYNKGNKIEKVEVEYEELKGDIISATWNRQFGSDTMLVGKDNVTQIHYQTKEYEQGIAERALGLNIDGKVVTQFGSLSDVANYSILIRRNKSTFNLIISPDNTINLKPIKESWSREEVEELILKFRDDNVRSNGKNMIYTKTWIKENL